VSCAADHVTPPTALKAVRVCACARALARCFPPAWCQQGLTYCTTAGLRYGLVQHTGGACGPLAVVQALILAHLMHGTHANGGASGDTSASAAAAAGAAAAAEAAAGAAAGAAVSGAAAAAAAVAAARGSDWQHATRQQQQEAVVEAVAWVLWQASGGGDGGGGGDGDEAAVTVALPQ
jgi:Domain of unknown function (DUF4205)